MQIFQWLTNETRKPTGIADSFTVTDDNTLASTDMYVDAAVELGGTIGSLACHNAQSSDQKDGTFLASDGSEYWGIKARYGIQETASTVTVKHDATPDGAALRVILTGIYSQRGATYGRLVTDNGGAGNTHFTDSAGLDWPVEDVDATTQPGYPVKISSGALVVDISTDWPGGDGIFIVHPSEGQVIKISNDAAGDAVFLDPADAEAIRLNGNLSGAADSSFTLASSSALGSVAGLPFLLPLYIDPTASAANRLQHDGFGGMLPMNFLLGGALNANRLIEAVYNADAAADGFRLRFKGGGFAYDNTDQVAQTNTKFYTSMTARIRQDINFTS